MARNKRTDGSGSIKVRKGRAKPFCAMVSEKSGLDRNGKVQISYKTIGSFKTRAEAEKALAEYNDCPLDISEKVKTFEDLYYAWSPGYFNRIQESSTRTIKAAYAYCSDIKNMEIRKIGPGHIKDVMEKGYVIDKNGEKRYASKDTKERIKSMCNLMFDYAVERRLINYNPARAFKVTKLIREIASERKIKAVFSEEDVQKMWKFVDVTPYTNMVLIGI